MKFSTEEKALSPMKTARMSMMQHGRRLFSGQARWALIRRFGMLPALRELVRGGIRYCWGFLRGCSDYGKVTT